MRVGVNLDKKKRVKFEKKEPLLIVGRFIKKNAFLPAYARVGGHLCLKSQGIFFSQLTNYCVYSYRARGVSKAFRMSRHVFKSFVNKGFIVGYKKGSW